MAYTFTVASPAYGPTGAGYNAVILNENEVATFYGSNPDAPANISSNGVSLPLHIGGDNAATLKQFFAPSSDLSSGLHEFYVSSNILQSNGEQNNAVGGLFYTTGGSPTGLSATIGPYSSVNNSFTVSVALNGQTYQPYNLFTGSFIVTDGAGFQATATPVIPQSDADLLNTFAAWSRAGAATITYQLSLAPPSAGAFHLYAAGYDVADDGLASTPTIQLTLPSAPPGIQFSPSPSTQYTNIVINTVNIIDPSTQTTYVYTQAPSTQNTNQTNQQFTQQFTNDTFSDITITEDPGPTETQKILHKYDVGIFFDVETTAGTDQREDAGFSSRTSAEILESGSAASAATGGSAAAVAALPITVTTVMRTDAQLLGQALALDFKLERGQATALDTQTALFHLVDGTTSVAEIVYSFFTGKTPTAAGLDYLLNTNGTGLKSDFYVNLTTENRYINMGVSLATGSGAGAAAFQANYGGLSLNDTVTRAYTAIFGYAPTADKVSAILNAQVSNGHGGVETRAQYFADITGGSAAGQKAAAIGFLLADSVSEGFGAYQQADQHFLADLAHGTAAFNVDLLVAYGQAPSLVGQPVVESAFGRPCGRRAEAPARRLSRSS